MTQSVEKDSTKVKFATYIIPGDPVALARARTRGDGGVWDPQRQIKLVCGIQLRNQHEDKAFFSGPLHIAITFFMEMTPTHKRKNLQGTFHHFRPDLDNLVKFLFDIGSDILYKEDCIISSLSAKKVYDLDPRTEFTISKVGQ